jgi:FkbM family methyltransferase
MLMHLARRASQAIEWTRTYRLCKRHIRKFGRRPVMALIGARDGAASIVKLLAKRGLIEVIGFEPDQAECERLRRIQPFARFEPIALGDVTASHPFYITRHPGCSSCLEPDAEILAAYPLADWFKVERTTQVMLHRFDELQLPRIDFLQIDVQGFETRVLQGVGKHLDTIIGIQSEAHFRPLYKTQALLWQLGDLLHARGLVLRQIRPQGNWCGEVVEAEVWFSRRANRLNDEQLSLLRIWESMCFLR